MATKQAFFPGAVRYFLLDTSAMMLLENFEIPLFEKRVQFREVLNEFVFRLDSTNQKIRLILEALAKHDDEKRKIYRGELTLPAEILHDALSTCLFEIAKLLESLSTRLRLDLPNNYADIFERIGKTKLQNIFDEESQLQYYLARLFLFPKLSPDKPNASQKDFELLCKREFEDKCIKITAFRDKVLAHPDDKYKFNTHLSHNEYFAVYNHLTYVLDAIAFVTTLSKNNWGAPMRDASQTKKWLNKGLKDSLKRFLKD